MRAEIALLGLSLTLGAAAAPASLPTPPEVVSHWEAHLASVKDYECVMESEEHGPHGIQKGSYHLWFRQPHLFRLKVVKGHDKGSELAVTPSGKVRARPGGLLGHVVTQTISKTDPRLRDARGGYPWESSFAVLCAEFRRHVQIGERCEVKQAPAASNALQIEVTFHDGGHSEREVWTLDPEHGVLSELDQFEDGALVQRTRFRDYREDLGLSDRFFEL